MGIERLIALLEESGAENPVVPPHAYLVMFGEQAELRGMQLAEQCRNQVPGLRLVVNCGAGSFKSQFKRADKSGAAWALILGEDELAANTIAVKDLRGDSEQQSIAQAELANWLQTVVKKTA
jgi:histidyl-tRNA synthetase